MGLVATENNQNTKRNAPDTSYRFAQGQPKPESVARQCHRDKHPLNTQQQNFRWLTDGLLEGGHDHANVAGHEWSGQPWLRVLNSINKTNMSAQLHHSQLKSGAPALLLFLWGTLLVLLLVLLLKYYSDRQSLFGRLTIFRTNSLLCPWLGRSFPPCVWKINQTHRVIFCHMSGRSFELVSCAILTTIRVTVHCDRVPRCKLGPQHAEDTPGTRSMLLWLMGASGTKLVE